MTIDKQKLQKLLWSEVASWKADCGEWKHNAEALGEFLGEQTVEEVALELLAENEALRKDAERLQSATAFVQKLCDSAGKQPSVATGYLHDILSAMSKGEQP
ncbi:hypothetical protein [Pseudomonas rustica]|uniref:hypothetical protein n=1 Tax=Pseudomonas rustica TaxID=2827099 RepID=UPI001BB04379|nr:hypothetical protein [Pseudomonas rustica]MBS4088709.1 hypothetical protein [Pseudomonas rustica]